MCDRIRVRMWAHREAISRISSVPFHIDGPAKTLNSAAGLPERVQIPVPPSTTSRLLYELLGWVRLGFLVVSPFQIACTFLHWERGRSSKRVWRSHRIIHLFTLRNSREQRVEKKNPNRGLLPGYRCAASTAFAAGVRMRCGAPGRVSVCRDASSTK
jgi:hypothetical protein